MAIAYIHNFETLIHSTNIDAFAIPTSENAFFPITARYASGFFARIDGFDAGGTTIYADDFVYFDNFGNNFLTFDLNQFIDLSSTVQRFSFSEVYYSNGNDHIDERRLSQTSDSSQYETIVSGNPVHDFRGGIDRFYVNSTFDAVSVTKSGAITTINGTPTRNLENVILNDGVFSLSQLTSRGTNDSNSNSSFGIFSNLVDDNFYYTKNPDVAAAGIDPEAHYYTNGHLEGRDPNWWFDTSFYLENNPDVAAAQAASGLNPLEHFMDSGNLTRDPMSLFDTSFYLQTNPDIAAAGINPLVHYLNHGFEEARSPYEGFSSIGYLQFNPDVAAAGLNPLEHWISHGQFEGRGQFGIFNYNEFDFF